jgi:hypothetical protein
MMKVRMTWGSFAMIALHLVVQVKADVIPLFSTGVNAAGWPGLPVLQC